MEEREKIYNIVSFIGILFRLCDFKMRTMKKQEVEEVIAFVCLFSSSLHTHSTPVEYWMENVSMHNLTALFHLSWIIPLW